jgi:hypothetical protein
MELAGEPRVGLLLVGARELQAVRAVDCRRVHVQALERLEDRLASAPEERDALVLLRVLGAVLEEEDVGERVARAQHGRLLLAGRLHDLAAELVDLGDRLLQVAL